ncbi:MAG: glycosyltransferase family 39 protein [Solirubrobacterales bacterium]
MDSVTRGFRPYLLLSLFCLVLYLPGLAALPPLDRDESRFMQATRQMIETGDFIRIQFQDEMRAKKPAGAYWLQAASVEALSHPKSTRTLPYRLPSALAAWAAVLMTFAFGRSLAGTRPALLAAGLLASALMLVSEAHQAKTDAILLACVVAAQGTLARFYVAGRTKELTGAAACGSGGGCGSATPVRAPLGGPGIPEALLFWVAQGAGILVKGPVVPMVSLLTIAVLAASDRNLRWFGAMKPVLGTIIAAAMAAPWFVAISQATGGAFVGAAVKGDLLPKLLGAQESHGGLPGMYLLLATVTFWPGSMLLWPALSQAWQQRARMVPRFLLAWAVPTWLVFELIPTKLPHYVLPAFPALALLVAMLVSEGLDVFRSRWARIWYAAWCVVGLTLAGAVVALPLKLGGGFDPSTVPAAIGIVLATLLPAWLAMRGRLVTAAFTLGFAALATYPAVFQTVLPHLDRMFVSRAVAETIDSLAINHPVASAGFHEPSLVFLMGTGTRLTDGAGAADFLAADPKTVAVVAEPERARFQDRAQALGLPVRELARVDGFNYSRGKPVSLGIWGANGP